MKIYFDKKPVANLDDVLSLYDSSEFESPTRSTVPLLSLLKDETGIWKTVMRKLGVIDSGLELHLEFRVDSPQGMGKPSHTDVMVIQDANRVAIEAKWTEPPYDTVGEWRGRGLNPTNRRDVMDGWLSLLQPHACRILDIEEFETARCQMVHRAASACHPIGRTTPALAYIQFSPLPPGIAPGIKLKLEQLQTDFSRLRQLLGTTEGFPFFLVEVTATPTEAFEEISKLAKGSRETAKAVCTAMRGAPLFEFKNPHFHPV